MVGKESLFNCGARDVWAMLQVALLRWSHDYSEKDLEDEELYR